MAKFDHLTAQSAIAAAITAISGSGNGATYSVNVPSNVSLSGDIWVEGLESITASTAPVDEGTSRITFTKNVV